MGGSIYSLVFFRFMGNTMGTRIYLTSNMVFFFPIEVNPNDTDLPYNVY